MNRRLYEKGRHLPIDDGLLNYPPWLVSSPTIHKGIMVGEDTNHGGRGRFFTISLNLHLPYKHHMGLPFIDPHLPARRDEVASLQKKGIW
ncbi:hypothetical protein QE390_004164 [Siphonobacter sp. SORGH_AS 1065]|nr:hypothetical protein [Siphonobacter sp. SORGH_AS_1065]